MEIAEQKMYTLEDIYNLPDGQRAELIDGAIYFMAPLNRRHQEILFSLSRKIADYKSPPMVARLLTGLFLFCGGESRGKKGMEYPSRIISILLKEQQKLNYCYIDINWYVKANDIILKNTGGQTGNPQNHAPQGQQKK